MKAIHNLMPEDCIKKFVGNYKLKYNFESNSQQMGATTNEGSSWEL
nr:hypothetical protein [Flavobacterium psychrotolerans]